jgi:hypothetical protein
LALPDEDCAGDPHEHRHESPPLPHRSRPRS